MKIGVFGGTFDPVHYGHIELAKQALDECKLDRVIVVPANEQPFKLDKEKASGEHRLNMLKLAFEQEDKIIISDIEIKKGDVSYTIDTLREICKLYNDAEIHFIVGIDAFLSIEFWKEAENLLSEYSFIVGARPNYMESELDELISRFEKLYNTPITRVNNELVPASSTEIKEDMRSNKYKSGTSPLSVERYIATNELYL